MNMQPVNFYQKKLAQNKAILAPMAGFSDAPFRKLCRRFGSAWAVTEMVSAKALVMGQQQGIEIGAPYPDEADLVIQVFGGEPEIVAHGGAILYAQYQPKALDINMGCPVKKVTGKSCGSKLMQDPERAADIVRQLVAAVPVPVSAKMRLGYDSENGKDVALALQEAGASLIAIHGRTAAQKYSGEANWQKIATIAEGLTTPVVGSGDVNSLAQFKEYQSWGLGVMVARASIGRPWIFSELQGKTSPSWQEQKSIIYEHAHSHVAWYSMEQRKKKKDDSYDAERRALRSFRGQLLRYVANIDNAKQGAIKIKSVGELESWLQHLPHPKHTHTLSH